MLGVSGSVGMRPQTQANVVRREVRSSELMVASSCLPTVPVAKEVKSMIRLVGLLLYYFALKKSWISSDCITFLGLFLTS